VNYKYILAAEKNFGPDIGSIKGKTTRRKIQTQEITMMSIADKYKYVTICIEHMFMHKVACLISISQSI